MAISSEDYKLMCKIREQPMEWKKLSKEEQLRAQSLIKRNLVCEECRNPRPIDGSWLGDFYLAGYIDTDCYLHLTVPEGVDALEDFAKSLHKEAKQEKQQRFENKISVAGVLVSFVTFIFGLIVEHFMGIVGFVVDLLG